MKSRFLFVLLFFALLLSGCSRAPATTPGSQTGIEVQSAWARVVPLTAMPGQGGAMATPASGMAGMATPAAGMGEMAGGMGNGAAYMLLINHGDEADKLLRVESDVAEAVELHISEVVNDIMTMRQVEAIAIPAAGQVELKPGGLHVMMIGMKRALQPGEKIMLTLIFENAPPQTIEVEVKQL